MALKMKKQKQPSPFSLLVETLSEKQEGVRCVNNHIYVIVVY